MLSMIVTTGDATPVASLTGRRFRGERANLRWVRRSAIPADVSILAPGEDA